MRAIGNTTWEDVSIGQRLLGNPRRRWERTHTWEGGRTHARSKAPRNDDPQLGAGLTRDRDLPQPLSMLLTHILRSPGRLSVTKDSNLPSSRSAYASRWPDRCADPAHSRFALCRPPTRPRPLPTKVCKSRQVLAKRLTHGGGRGAEHARGWGGGGGKVRGRAVERVSLGSPHGLSPP